MAILRDPNPPTTVNERKERTDKIIEQLTTYMLTSNRRKLDNWPVPDLQRADEDLGALDLHAGYRIALGYQIARRTELDASIGSPTDGPDVTEEMRAYENLQKITLQLDVLLDYFAILTGVNSPPTRDNDHDSNYLS